MKFFNIVLVCVSLIAGFACKNSITQTGISNNILALLDAGSTDAWLNVKTSSLTNTVSSISIKQNQQILLTVSLPHADTVLYVDSLIPNHSYRLIIEQMLSFGSIDSSESFVFATLDTTSHNFTWQTDTLGDGNSSVLNDVAIINDTVIYVVGTINKKDSLGSWIIYNLAKWNGINWQLQVLPVPVCGTNYTDPFPLYCVFSFSPTNVWFSGGGEIEHWDGNRFSGDCSMNTLISGQLTKIWGTSSQNLYAVGRSGTIIHYDGHAWQKMESGTNIDLLDVWGSPDGGVVWACGFKDCCPGTCLLRNTGAGWQIAYDGTASEFTVKTDSLSGAFSTVYTPNSKRVFVGSPNGVYSALSTTHGQGKRMSFTVDYFPGFPYRLRGQGVNDYMLVGEYAMIAHYNGIGWKYYSELANNNERINSVDQRGNLVVGVGFLYDPINSKGIVFRGKR